VAQTVEGSSPNGETAWRRSAPVDTDEAPAIPCAKERNQAAGGGLKASCASASFGIGGTPAKARHGTLAVAMVRTCCLAGVGAWPRHRRLERKEARRRSTAASFKAVTARGAMVEVLAWGRATRQRGWGGAPAQPVGGGGRQ
jgi:hypothetical protein